VATIRINKGCVMRPSSALMITSALVLVALIEVRPLAGLAITLGLSLGAYAWHLVRLARRQTTTNEAPGDHIE